MEPVVQELRQRLDSLVDEWLKSTGPDRTRLVREKIRLEELIEALENDGGHGVVSEGAR